MNIYIGCGLTHVPRQIFGSYTAYLHDLANELRVLPLVTSVRYALVDSDPQLATRPSSDRAALCYDWDRRMVEQADLLIAEGSFPSTGLGIELQIAETSGKPVIMLIGDLGINRVERVRYENPDHGSHELQIGDGIVSLMALGLPAIRKIVSYSTFEEAILLTTEAVALYCR
ncbi:MAG: hypothetical protein SFW09_15330 [Hyphomicrobiaceae bacterium]|nr:hypothetical protein [Hyphomicrobiaceae bacterium]